MKKAIHFLAFSLLIACSLQAQKPHPQSIISDAFFASFATEKSNLDPLITRWKIQDLDHSEKYWMAYACQQNGIVYMSKKNMEKAEENVSLAIRTLESIEELSSEDHSLLGALLSLSITFDPTSAMQLSMQSNKHYEKSLKKDPNNMRAYLGMGKGDFYTPVQYGGGKVVEKNLQKALALPAQSSETENAPSWGRDEAFMFLAQFYEREGRDSEAMLICKKGLKEFPDHGPLKETMGKVKG